MSHNGTLFSLFSQSLGNKMCKNTSFSTIIWASIFLSKSMYCWFMYLLVSVKKKEDADKFKDYKTAAKKEQKVEKTQKAEK